jgi:hypothetical protein
MPNDHQKYEPKRFSSLNPFRDIRNWTRVLFVEDLGSPVRPLAVLETDHDLQKEVQNLLCDVHEEALLPIITNEEWQQMPVPERRLHLALQKLMGVNKRLASLLTVSALETARVNSLLLWLTAIIIFQTFAVIGLTVVMLLRGMT